MLKIEGAKIFVSQIESFLFKNPYLNHQYEIVISTEDNKDILIINVKYKDRIIPEIKQNTFNYKTDVKENSKASLELQVK